VLGIFFSIEAEMPPQIKFPTSKKLYKDPLGKLGKHDHEKSNTRWLEITHRLLRLRESEGARGFEYDKVLIKIVQTTFGILAYANSLVKCFGCRKEKKT